VNAAGERASKPFPWWRCFLGYVAMEMYVFTGSRRALMVMEWAMGPPH
jgi:hypothetical protein